MRNTFSPSVYLLQILPGVRKGKEAKEENVTAYIIQEGKESTPTEARIEQMDLDDLRRMFLIYGDALKAYKAYGTLQGESDESQDNLEAALASFHSSMRAWATLEELREALQEVRRAFGLWAKDHLT